MIDCEARCHGSEWQKLRESIARAAFVLTLADPTWFDELEACPRRAFVDGDPMFTQVAMLEPGSKMSKAVPNYPVLFTYGVRMGKPDCSIPSAGRTWIPTRPVVATARWTIAPAQTDGLPITALMHWAAGGDLHYQGRAYGHKDRELKRFIDLPRKTTQEFALAVGGGRAPRESLGEHGWTLMDPLATTRSIEAYEQFIRASRADFGIAKHAYVASHSGWFSDRGACFLAAGRPVLHQDTGLSDWLPIGEGVLLFSDEADVLEGVRQLDADYLRHARAARRIAEEHFEARVIVGRMIEEAGFA